MDHNDTEDDFLPTNMSNAPMPSYQLALVIASIFISIFGLSGYAAYIYIVRKYKYTFSNPFYTFALSLAIPDCLVGLTMLAYSYPVILARSDPYWPWVGVVLGVVMDATWFSLISHVAVIATNRMTAVVCYARVNEYFSATRVKTILASCYTFATTMTLLQYACGCGQFFIDDSWNLDCDESKAAFCGRWPLTVDMCVSNGMVVYVILLNLLIVILAKRATRKIRQDQKDNLSFASTSAQRAASERSMIIQCALVSLVLTTYQGSFWLTGYLKANNVISVSTASVTENLLAAVNSAMNPVIYFVFSSEVRRKVWPSKKHTAIKPLLVKPQQIAVVTLCVAEKTA